ncbi:O-antigen ligase family protein [bacterium]|nr:O-antigen ligase family protein [bacterium]
MNDIMPTFPGWKQTLSGICRGFALMALTLIALFPALASLGYCAKDYLHLSPEAYCAQFGGASALLMWLCQSDATAVLPNSANLLRILAFIALAAITAGSSAWPQRGSRVFAGLLAFLGLSAASLCLQPYSYASVADWGNILAAAACFIAASMAAHTWDASAVTHFYSRTIAISVFLALLGVWHSFTFADSPDSVMKGCFINQNAMAAWLILPLPLLIIKSFSSEWNSSRLNSSLAYLFLLCAALVTIGFSFNRTAWALTVFLILQTLSMSPQFSRLRNAAIACVAALSVPAMLGTAVFLWKGYTLAAAGCGLIAIGALVWLGKKTHLGRQPQFWLRLAVIAIIAASMTAAFKGMAKSPDGLASKRLHEISQHGDTSRLARLEFYRCAWEMAADHPWLGLGPEAFKRWYPKYQQDWRWYSTYSHCLTLDVMSEFGIPAALLLLAAGLYALWISSSGAENEDSAQTSWRLGLLLGSVGIIIHAQMDVDFKSPVILTHTAIAFGIAMGLASAGSSKALRPAWRLPLLLTALAALAACLYVSSGEFYLQSAQCYAKANMHLQALNSLERSVKCVPCNDEAHRQLAWTLISHSDMLRDPNWSQALDRHSELAYIYSPRSYSCNLLRARALELHKSFREALAFYQKALDIDQTNDLTIYTDLARMLYRNSQLEDAVGILDGVLRSHPAADIPSMTEAHQITSIKGLNEVYDMLFTILPTDDRRVQLYEQMRRDTLLSLPQYSIYEQQLLP